MCDSLPWPRDPILNWLRARMKNFGRTISSLKTRIPISVISVWTRGSACAMQTAQKTPCVNKACPSCRSSCSDLIWDSGTACFANSKLISNLVPVKRQYVGWTRSANAKKLNVLCVSVFYGLFSSDYSHRLFVNFYEVYLRVCHSEKTESCLVRRKIRSGKFAHNLVMGKF